MIDTVEKALSPIFLAASFLGFGILRYPLNQPRYRLSIFYILTVWSVYAYVLYYTMTYLFLEGVYTEFITFGMTVNLLAAITSIIITNCKYEKYRQYTRKLDLVDDTLEELGIPKEYYKMRNLTRKALIMWFLMICITWTFDSLVCIGMFHDTRAIFMPFITSYSIHVNSITDITFILLLRHIGDRLDKINNHIKQLSETEDCGLRCKWKKFLVVKGYNVRNAKNRKHILWIVIHLHLELCRTARDINGFFGVQMTLQIISYFILLNEGSYFEYHTILHLKEIINNNVILKTFLSSIMWFFIFLTKLISLNHICESVSAKAHKTKSIIHKLTNLICFAEAREEIYQFVLQVSLRPLKFSGLGLFYFGYAFIRKFFVWTLTIVIFMAQMDFVPVWNTIDRKI
ncbi:putative gustatory receptor 28b [Temnothorax longispinosus]|uniref:putative gustatory receptor 28b n=1 Tax=Temnothorax longispinosus TaxID=300112 RepID=UPI003A9A4BC4